MRNSPDTPACIAALLAPLLLAGCSDADSLKSAISGLERGCAVPLRMELHAGFWAKGMVVSCDKLKPVQWEKQ